jgi:hypothetical protein
VKIAVRSTGRWRPAEVSSEPTIARISASAGMSTPILSLPLPSARREGRFLRSE